MNQKVAVAAAPCENHDPENNCRYAEHAADMAVKKVFAILGVDIDKPESVEEFREDLRFGKRMRRAADKGLLSAVGLIVVAMGSLIWYGLKAALAGHS